MTDKLDDVALAAIKARHEQMTADLAKLPGWQWLIPKHAEEAHADRAALLAEVDRLREALEPFAHYARQRARAPFRGLDDVIHGIHIGTEYEAEIRLSHCEAARAALARAGGAS